MALIEESRPHGSVVFAALSDEHRAEVLAESHLIVSHSSFKTSKRCIMLFQFVIEHVLAGDHENLKERTLGVEVFGRNPDYDTNADPIVRITASEIRKRLAQYYQQKERPRQVRIQLVPGSYVPQFKFTSTESSDTPMEPSDDTQARTTPEPQVVLPTTAQTEPNRWLFVGGVTLGVLVVALAGWFLLAPHFVSTQKLIWAPILHANGPVVLSVSDGYEYSASSDGLNSNWAADLMEVISTGKFELPRSKEMRRTYVPVVDAQVAMRVTAFLSADHHETLMRETSAMSLDDLRQGPDVIIGAFDNPWSLVLLSRLRFHVMIDPSNLDEWIEDAQNPGHRVWMASGKTQFSDSSADYALISRVRSTDTGTWIFAIAGLGLHGTEAAGELVTNPNFAKVLPNSLRDTKKNFQLVIKTAVINGNSGPPEIVATYVW